MEQKIFSEIPQDMQVVIGIIGPKGAGKDTIADYSIKNWGAKGKIVTAFFLKQMCSKIFNLSPIAFTIGKEKPFANPIRLQGHQLKEILNIIRQNIPETLLSLKEFNPKTIGLHNYIGQEFKTPRELLQYIGTDFIQSFYKPFHAYMAYKKMINSTGVWFISDMRFLHEYQSASSLFPLFYTVRILDRNEVEDGKEEHVSEREFKQIPINATISNDNDLNSYYVKSQQVFKEIMKDALIRYPSIPKQQVSFENTQELQEVKQVQHAGKPHFVFQHPSQARPNPIRFY